MRDALDGIEPKSLEHHHGIKRASSAMRAEETRALQRECSVLAMTAGAVSRAVSDAMSLLSVAEPLATSGVSSVSRAPMVDALVRAVTAERLLASSTETAGGLAGALEADASASVEPVEGSVEPLNDVPAAGSGAAVPVPGSTRGAASLDVGPSLGESLVALLQAASSLEVPAIASLAALPATAYVGSATSSLTSRTAARAAAAFASLEQASASAVLHAETALAALNGASPACDGPTSSASATGDGPLMAALRSLTDPRMMGSDAVTAILDAASAVAAVETGDAETVSDLTSLADAVVRAAETEGSAADGGRRGFAGLRAPGSVASDVALLRVLGGVSCGFTSTEGSVSAGSGVGQSLSHAEPRSQTVSRGAWSSIADVATALSSPLLRQRHETATLALMRDTASLTAAAGITASSAVAQLRAEVGSALHTGSADQVPPVAEPVSAAEAASMLLGKRVVCGGGVGASNRNSNCNSDGEDAATADVGLSKSKTSRRPEFGRRGVAPVTAKAADALMMLVQSCVADTGSAAPDAAKPLAESDRHWGVAGRIVLAELRAAALPEGSALREEAERSRERARESRRNRKKLAVSRHGKRGHASKLEAPTTSASLNAVATASAGDGEAVGLPAGAVAASADGSQAAPALSTDATATASARDHCSDSASDLASDSTSDLESDDGSDSAYDSDDFGCSSSDGFSSAAEDEISDGVSLGRAVAIQPASGHDVSVAPVLESDSDCSDSAVTHAFDAPSAERQTVPTSPCGSTNSNPAESGDVLVTGSAVADVPLTAAPILPVVKPVSQADHESITSASQPNPAAAAEAALAAASRALATATATDTPSLATPAVSAERSHSTITSQSSGVGSSADEEWFDAMGRPDTDGQRPTSALAPTVNGGATAESADSVGGETAAEPQLPSRSAASSPSNSRRQPFPGARRLSRRSRFHDSSPSHTMALPTEPDMIRAGGSGLLGLLPPSRTGAPTGPSDRLFGRLDHHRHINAPSPASSLHPMYAGSTAADVGLHGAVSLSSAVAMPPLGVGGTHNSHQTHHPNATTGTSSIGAAGGFGGNLHRGSAGRASGVSAAACVGSGAGYLDYLRCIVSDRA